MSAPWTDLGGTSASAISGVVFSAPIPGVATNYVLTQKFMQPLSAFTPLALNTPHGTYTDYLLVEESEKENLGEGIISWTRTYAKVPAQHIEPETMPYQFIGLAGDFGIPNALPEFSSPGTGRWKFSDTVPVKAQYDYFLIDGSTYTDLQSLIFANFIDATRYYIAGNTSWMAEWLVDSPPFTFGTTPSLSDYNGFISADAASGSSYSLVGQASVFNRWKGNIIQRITRYIKAI